MIRMANIYMLLNRVSCANQQPQSDMQNTYGGGRGGSGDPSNWLCFLPFRPHCGRREKEKTKTDDVQIFPTFTQLPESMILGKDNNNPEKGPDDEEQKQKESCSLLLFHCSPHHHPLVFADRCYDYGFEKSRKSRQMLPPLDEATGTFVLVNSKQYHGIIRRRRAKAKQPIRTPSNKKSITDQKPYKHESRHLHAMRRARGQGGRFLNTKKDKSPNAVAISFLEIDDLNKIPKSSPSLFTGFMCNTSNIHTGINPPSSVGMSDKDEGSDVGGGFTTKWVTSDSGVGATISSKSDRCVIDRRPN